MRIFSYRDQSNKKSIGVLCKKDSSEFVDLCATDASIPADLGSLIVIDPQLALAKKALANPNAIIKKANTGKKCINSATFFSGFDSPTFNLQL
jgi:hypothetical protein